MNRFTLKMLLRSIRASLGRYLAILSIVALGVGFFAGLKCSRSAMLTTADEYLRSQRFQDFQLLSTLGFTGEDEEAFAAREDVLLAEGAYFADVILDGDGGEEVWRFMSLTERVSVPLLTAGRMPASAEECLGDEAVLSQADIGSTVTLSPDNDEDTLALFKRESFTVVGLARSPRYMSADRGGTALGSGSLRGFIMLPKESFDSPAYHELLLWCGFEGVMYSPAYAAARDRAADGIRSFLNQRGRLRYRALVSELEKELAQAREEIDDGWAELLRGEEESRQQLAQAREELEAGERELRQNRETLTDALRQLQDGMAALPAARREIAQGRAELEENRATLEENERQLTLFRSLYDEAARLLSEREDELRALLAQNEAARYAALAPYYQAVVTSQTQVYLLRGRIDAIQNGQGDPGELEALEEQLSQAEAELAQAEAELAAQEAAFDPDTAQIIDVEAVIEQIRGGMAELDAQLTQGEQALADGKAQLADAESQLNSAQARLDKAERDYPGNLQRINDGFAQLNQGQRELEEGWQAYYDGQAQAEAELAQGREDLLSAEAELADARRDAMDALRLEVYCLNRSTNPGYVTFESDTGIVSAIANAFPVFFALIAALVCVTTMTRMVNEERTLIGTMKAMGYGGGVIMSKYLCYAGSASLLGCMAGFFLGTSAIPYVIWRAYNIMYRYARLRFYFSPALYAACLAVAVAGALLVTALACRQEMNERPASLIRPKAPGKGKRILLERITPLWNALSFLSKVTARNAFRYRQRVIMILLGIGGCTALIVTGFGINNSIADLGAHQFEEVSMYDAAVTLDTAEFASDEAAAELWREEAERYAMTWQESVTLRSDKGEMSTRLVAAGEDALRDVISLHDGDEPLPYPGPGEAVIARKLASRLSLKAGDRAELTLGSGESISLTVTGVCDNYLQHYIYVCLETVGSPRSNTALVRGAPGVEPGRLAARLRASDGVEYVSLTAQERETMEQSMASLDLIVVVLVICSGVLAFITLYNLTNINIMERSREIATVKVLGFFPAETASYILRENLILSVLGALLGLGLGKLLHGFVMGLIDVENLTCDVRILPLSYALSFLITLLFAVGTNLLMRIKLEKVNMAESLKSVE